MNLENFEKILSSYPETTNFIASLATPSIALMALIFAALQWHTNRNRLRHELFDRRYQQYEAIKDFLGNISSLGKMTPDAEVQFLTATKGMRFTFSRQISRYVEEHVWSLAVDLNVLNDEMADRQRIEEGVARERGELMKAIIGEISKSEEVFSKYLQLKH